ncbi:phage head-tail joining protein [Escherichia coli]|uniref:phage head-tail joining protein n=1 Tax=Escherichia coli TaxID=562 RepID=UPI003D2EFA35
MNQDRRSFHNLTPSGRRRHRGVQKDGRRIEYTAASLDELNRAINDAESVLGTTRCRRRPLGVRL